jgi:hypothetical protein
VTTLTVDNAPPPDTTAPVTSIGSPADGSTVAGTVSVSASASDAVGVTRVELLVDGVFHGSDTTAPYGFSWDTTSVSDGTHTLQTRAFDAAGNVGSSTVITLTVDNVPVGDPELVCNVTVKLAGVKALEVGDMDGEAEFALTRGAFAAVFFLSEGEDVTGLDQVVFMKETDKSKLGVSFNLKVSDKDDGLEGDGVDDTGRGKQVRTSIDCPEIPGSVFTKNLTRVVKMPGSGREVDPSGAVVREGSSKLEIHFIVESECVYKT